MIGSKRIETTARVVWTIPLPCYYGDISAVMCCIQSELGADIYLKDDAYKIEADECEMRLSYASDSDGRPA